MGVAMAEPAPRGRRGRPSGSNFSAKNPRESITGKSGGTKHGNGRPEAAAGGLSIFETDCQGDTATTPLSPATTNALFP